MAVLLERLANWISPQVVFCGEGYAADAGANEKMTTKKKSRLHWLHVWEIVENDFLKAFYLNERS